MDLVQPLHHNECLILIYLIHSLQQQGLYHPGSVHLGAVREHLLLQLRPLLLLGLYIVDIPLSVLGVDMGGDDPLQDHRGFVLEIGAGGLSGDDIHILPVVGELVLLEGIFYVHVDLGAHVASELLVADDGDEDDYELVMGDLLEHELGEDDFDLSEGEVFEDTEDTVDGSKGEGELDVLGGEEEMGCGLVVYLLGELVGVFGGGVFVF